MGHQFPRAVAAAAVAVVLVVCGGSDGDGSPEPVLDIARDQVEGAAPDDSIDDSLEGTTVDESSHGDAPLGDDVPDELPPPDPSMFEGANRIVNLWVGPDGETGPIDVWGRRTFTNGPILLAEGVPYAEASDYFQAPTGYSLVVVGAGAGPDGEERAGLFNAADGEQITTIFTNADELGG